MECSALLNGFLYSKIDSNLATKMSARIKIDGVSAQEWGTDARWHILEV
jgi:hypothetical protein